jgi:hypothetical protein
MGSKGKGKSKSRTSEQASAAATARWEKYRAIQNATLEKSQNA